MHLATVQRVRNTAVYQLASQVASPVDLATMKSYLKITATADDTLIQSMIDAATDFLSDESVYFDTGAEGDLEPETVLFKRPPVVH